MSKVSGIYEIILVDGIVLKCWTDDMHLILKEYLNPEKGRFWIVRENNCPEMKMNTCIRKDRVSHIRLPNEACTAPL